jgi:SAM-dependent methyltransferase
MSKLTLALVAFLQSAPANEALRTLTGDALKPAQALPTLTRLRKTFSMEEASALLELARTRQKAVAKFGDRAHAMLFTPDALEQASHPLLRAYRATRLRGRVLDVCCGVGADSLAMAEAGSDVLGVDIDPVRVAMAQHNAVVWGVPARFVVQDADTLGDCAGYDWLFYDPARRDDDGKRIFDVRDYQPPLDWLARWRVPYAGAKLAPSVDWDDVRGLGQQLEYVSVKGDMKEAILWRSPSLEGARPRLATLITDAGAHTWAGEMPDAPPQSHAPQAYLHEPDASLLRAGEVASLALAIGAHFLDPTIAYLTTAHPVRSVWARSWRVQDWMPFQLKRLRAYLRERNIGRVTVKKRGFPMLPEELLAQLKPKGDNACTLFMTRCDGSPIAIVCEADEIAL